MIFFGNQVENSRHIRVVKFPSQFCAFFEPNPFAFAQRGHGNKLHRDRAASVLPHCLVGDDGAVMADLARRSIVVQTNRIIFGKHFPSDPHLPRNYCSTGRVAPDVIVVHPKVRIKRVRSSAWYRSSLPSSNRLRRNGFSGMATPLGFEPRITPPKGAVIPLHHGVIASNEVRRRDRTCNWGVSQKASTPELDRAVPWRPSGGLVAVAT